MNEQDLFEIMDGLPARQIAEAAEWRYRRDRNENNEIDKILANSAVPEKRTYRNPQQEPKKTGSDPVTEEKQTGGGKLFSVIHSAAAGLAAVAAVAAVFAVAFGGIALKLYRDNAEHEASLPGTAVSDSEIGVTEVTSTDLAALTVAPTGYETTAETSGTTVTFSSAAETVPLAEDNTVSAGELNFLGGHGLLRPITPNDSSIELFQDDDYIYLEGSKRILKENLSPNGTSGELVCQTRGCAHNTEDCPYYRYGSGQLICGNHELYYCDYEMYSPKQGFSGGLKRIFSDGSTEDLVPADKIYSPALIIGNAYYLNVFRLGDTGIYLLDMYYSPFEQDGAYVTENDASGFYELVLLDSRTGETIPMNDLCEKRFMTQLVVQFDEADQRLFVSNSNYDFAESVLEIDIYTGNLIAEYRPPQAPVSDWFYAEGRLHYLSSGGEGQPRGTTAWYTCDLESGENETVAETCKLRSFCYFDGRVYAIRHESVGMDAVVSYAPDGTDEQVIAETKGSLDAISQVFDPERITVYSATNTLDMYLTDPEKGIVRLMF